jgi:hypothetical protein
VTLRVTVDLDAATAHRRERVRPHGGLAHLEVVGLVAVEHDRGVAAERLGVGAHPERAVHHDVARPQCHRPVGDRDVAVDEQAA